jgi:hypothetical protein
MATKYYERTPMNDAAEETAKPLFCCTHCLPWMVQDAMLLGKSTTHLKLIPVDTEESICMGMFSTECPTGKDLR